MDFGPQILFLGKFNIFKPQMAIVLVKFANEHINLNLWSKFMHYNNSHNALAQLVD